MLHGIIGLEVDGSAIANEIAFLNSIGASEIVERINSIGGSVAQGFSIVSANLLSKVKIITVCEGVCDSIASLILASGDERKVLEFGSGLIHNVLFEGVTLEGVEDDDEREEARKMNDAISNVLLNKTKLKKKELSELMAKETRFSATELVENGFADEVIPIGKGKKKPALMGNCTREEYMNVCKEFSAEAGQNNNQNKRKMKEVFKFLNLNAEASEDAVLSSLKNLQDKAQRADGLQTKVGELKAENDTLKKGKAESEVQGYIDKGLFDAAKKDELVNMAISQPEAFKVLTFMKPEYVNISDDLKSGGKKGDEKKELTEKELADKYQNLADNDPGALTKMEENDLAGFEKMLNAWQNA